MKLLVCFWWIFGTLFILLSPVFYTMFHIYFYYKREFIKMKNIIEKLKEGQ